MLQKALLPVVRRTSIGCMQKRFVGRDVANRNELSGQKRVAMDCNTFMWRPGTHRVNRICSRCEPPKPPQRSLCFPDSRIHSASSSIPGRERKHHLPDPRRSVFGIFRQQFVQKSRATSRHTGDENGPLNGRSRQGLQPPIPCLDQPQSSLEQFEQVNPHEKPAQWVQVALMFQAAYQSRERRLDWRFTKIFQSSAAPCLSTERLAL